MPVLPFLLYLRDNAFVMLIVSRLLRRFIFLLPILSQRPRFFIGCNFGDCDTFCATLRFYQVWSHVGLWKKPARICCAAGFYNHKEACFLSLCQKQHSTFPTKPMLNFRC